MSQLAEILPYLRETGDGMTMLFRGPSGWGKTRMCFMICNYLAYGNYDYCLGDDVKISPDKRLHFVDEVHLMQNPESLYPLIDSNKHVFVLATNDRTPIVEALVNRSSDFIFGQYSIDELREISGMYIKVPLNPGMVDYLIDCGGGNPRIIRNIINRLNIFLIRDPEFLKGFDLPMFKVIMEKIFGTVDGLDVLCQRYMSALDHLGGTASLQTIANIVHVDKDTIQHQVEPILLYKDLIIISNKGRSKK